MEEDKIEVFFRQMKKEDEEMVIPPFPKRKGNRWSLPSFRYAATAIVTALVIVAYLVRQTGQEPVQAGEVVILVGQDPLKTHSLINVREESLSEWESPTEYLSDDF